MRAPYCSRQRRPLWGLTFRRQFMELDSGNIAWMLTASALVLFMTPGLGFFYGGLTRNKNVLATIMQSFITTGIVAILWVTVGYSLAFGPDQGYGLIGNFDWVGLKDVG